MLSIHELFAAGSQALEAEHDALESTKVGILRAGNTGAVLADGSIVGKCHRQTWLRFNGTSIEDNDSRKGLMFAAGISNEDSWYSVLSRAWDGPILREEEIPIRWELEIGDTKTLVTGRPDLVIGTRAPKGIGIQKADGSWVKPLIGIELKLVSSVWTARDVGIQMKPKMPHLLQAAHYSWQMGVPFEIWYACRADFAVTGWAQKQFPYVGERGSELCEYNDKGEIKKVRPFIQGYRIDIREDGHIWWKACGPAETDWVRSPASVQSIENYYKAVLAVGEGKLGPRPKSTNADGSKGSFNLCDYCPLRPHCDATEKKPEEWLAPFKNTNNGSKAPPGS